MESEEKNIKSNDREVSNYKRGTKLKWFWKVPVVIIAIFLALSVFISFIFVFNFSKTFILRTAVNIVNKEFNGRVSFENVHLNLFEGIIIENLVATLEADTIAFVRKVRIDWDLNPMLSRNVLVNVVELDNARIYLVKDSAETKWNYEKFFKIKEKTQQKSKANLNILLKKIKVNNSSIFVVDRNHQPKSQVFDPLHLALIKVNLEADGRLDLSTDKFEFNVNNISFNENHSKFELNAFSTKLTIDSSGIRATKVHLETPKTFLNANIFYSFKTTFVTFDLSNTVVNTSDILKFAHLPLGPNSSIAVSTKALYNGSLILDGTSLLVDNRTKIELDGGIDLKKETPNIIFYIKYANISENDVRKLLPEIFQNVPVNFVFFLSKGFSFKFLDKSIYLFGKFVTSAGKVNSKLTIDSNLVLNYDISYDNLNLRKLLQELPSTKLSGISKGSFNLNDFTKLKGFLTLLVNSGNADIKGFDNFKLSLAANFNKGKVEVEDLSFTTFSKDSLSSDEGNFHFVGNLDITDFKSISYSGSLDIQNLKAKNFFSSSGYIPEKISGKIHFNGVGTDINNILLNLQGNVEEFSLADRTLFPFSINVSIDHRDSLERKFSIDSDILSGKIVGQYKFLSLVQDLANQFKTITQSFQSKIDKILNDSVVQQVDLKPKGIRTKSTESTKFHNSNFFAEFNINDFSILAVLLNTNLIFSGKVNLNIKSNETESEIKVDSLIVRYFSLDVGKTKINLSNTVLDLAYTAEIIEAMPVVKNFSANFSTENRIIMGDSYFDFLDLALVYSKDTLSIVTNSNFNSAYGARLNFQAAFLDSIVNLNFDEFSIAYQNIFQWNLKSPFSINANSEKVVVDSLILQRENAETISLSGQYFFNKSLFFQGNIIGIPLNDFQKLLPSDNSLSKIKNFKGKVEQINFSVTNTLERPSIYLSLFADDLMVEDIKIGNLDVALNYKEQSLSGKLKLSNNNIAPLIVNILDIPIIINLDDMEFGVVKDKEFSGYLECERFSLDVLSPFVSNDVENLRGDISFATKVSGYLPEDLKFYGYIDILESSFVTVANNLKYILKGRIQLDGTRFTFDELRINNVKEDFKDGSGTLSGSIVFANNRLETIDLSLYSNGIKVLSNSSVKSMPQLYGNLIISTNPTYLRFSYDRNEMTLQGNVNFLSGRLFMPGTAGSENVQESFVQYEISGWKKIDTTQSKTQEPETKKKPNNLKVDLTLRFIQPIELTLELATIGQIYAIISLEDNSSSLRFYSDPKNNIVLLTGNALALREGSTLKFVKLFNTEGTINFPTGSIDNPGLNLKAYYNGQSIYNDAIRNYTVTIYITGTREKPSLRFDYTIDGQSATDDSSKVAQDAIFLLVFGRTKSELEKGGVSTNFNISDVSMSGSSALLSKLVSDALSGTGFISSADILLPPTASSLDRATLKMSGRFLGMTWNFGGTMADLLNNNELSIEVPIGTVLPFSFPNIILQLSRSSNLTQTIQRNQKDWEIKLKYGSTW